MLGERTRDLGYWEEDEGCSVRYWHGYGGTDGSERAKEFATSKPNQ